MLLIIFLFLDGLINNVLTWSHFSNTIINKNGIYDLYGLKGYCPPDSVVRGIQLDKPTNSTFRYALNCFYTNGQKTYISHYVSDQVNCTDNSFSWLTQLPIECPRKTILVGLSLENYSPGLCGIHYLCSKIQGSLCSNYKAFKTETKDNVLIPIVSKSHNGGISSISLKFTEGKGFYYSYDWCFIPQYNNTNVLMSVQPSIIKIEFFFRLDDIEKVDFIINVLQKIILYFEGEVIFIPHYLVDFEEEGGKNCYGLYCLDNPWRVRESLIQYCIYENHKEEYFNYLVNYRKSCSHLKEYSLSFDCGNFKSEDIDKCFMKSFRNNMKQNTIFDGENAFYLEKKISRDFPLIINEDHFRLLSQEEITQIICNKRTDIAKCQKGIKMKEINIKFFFIATSLILALITLLLYLIKKNNEI